MNIHPLFHFGRGILGIRDPDAEALLWNPRNFGSQAEKMSLDPVDPGSFLGNLLAPGISAVARHCMHKILTLSEIFVSCAPNICLA